MVGMAIPFLPCRLQIFYSVAIDTPCEFRICLNLDFFGLTDVQDY